MKAPVGVPVRHPAMEASGLNLGDLYRTFFRHKWKILLIFLLGLVGAAVYYRFLAKPAMYQSEAKILIRFIVENKAGTSAKDEAQMKSLDSGGISIINSEIEILTSLDLALQVVDALGPEKILAKLGGGNDRTNAAAVIHEGLMAFAPRNSNILLITFRHPDQAVVQPVLSQLIETYRKRHVEIHQGVGLLDGFFAQQADDLRARLVATEANLKKLKMEAQIISLDDSKRSYVELTSKISQELLNAEAQLAERRTLLGEPEKLPPGGPAATNTVAVVTPEKSEQYRRACLDLDALQLRLADLRTRYTDEHFQVRSLLTQIAAARTRKQELETAAPELLRLAPLAAPDALRNQVDYPTELRRIAALESKIKALAGQLEKIRADASRVSDVEPELLQLQRQKEAEEISLRFYNQRVEQARIDESLGAGKITNISVVQAPTPPVRDAKNVLKPMLMILLVGCCGGFAWGFVSDKILDRSIKCVADVERQVHLPLFISVPDTAWRPGSSVLAGGRRTQAPVVTADRPSGRETSQAVAPWEAHHELRPYFEGLRDRLITHFEVRDINHKKPKLVAVTSCNHGAGVSTMAAGLAAALSETGDGNVLLVDMNLEKGAARAFAQGKPSVGLAEALDQSTRDSALVQENLYIVSAGQASGQSVARVLPKGLANLVPRMKASDYDYIIFDMPPVTQTSVTARMSGFMDMNLVVIEAEQTGQEIVQRANGLLQESRANVATILNKHRAYVPQNLSQEL